MSNSIFAPFRRAPTALLAMLLALTAMPLHAATVSASYFAFEPNKHYFSGDADTSNTRARAVVDSGFVHVPIFNQGDWIFQAKASADLISGSLRTFAFSDTTDFHADQAPPTFQGGYESLPSASLLDVVTFTAPVGAPAGNGRVPITFKLDVSGRFAGFYSNMANTTSLQVFTPGSLQKSQVEFSWSGRDGAAGTPHASAVTSGTVSNLVVNEPGQLHALLAATVMVRPGDPISIAAAMGATADTGSFASALVGFDHTASLSIEAPVGYSFVSASGLLLSQPVPLPAAVWMLTPALLVLRRRCRFAPAEGGIPSAVNLSSV